MNRFFQTAQDSERARLSIVFAITVVLAFMLPALIIPTLSPLSEEPVDLPIWQEEVSDEIIQKSPESALPQADDELSQESHGDDFIYLVHEID